MHYRGPRRKREKGPKKIVKEIIAENFPNMGKEIINKVQEAQSFKQDRNKEEHTEIHSNQTAKIKHTDTVLKATRGK